MHVNEYQVGGTHYQSNAQHWDWVEKNGLRYLVGCATKYVTRNRKKFATPILDLEKALHYIDKLISMFDSHLIEPRDPSLPWPVPCELFCEVNQLTPVESDIVTTLAHWQTENDLFKAREWTRSLLQAAKDDSLADV